MISPLPFPPEDKPHHVIAWLALLLAAAVITGIFLLGCNTMTPEMQTLIKQHTKAVDFYIDGTLPLKPEFKKLAKAIKETNRTLEDFANGKDK